MGRLSVLWKQPSAVDRRHRPGILQGREIFRPTGKIPHPEQPNTQKQA
jgi:hypothetical protein